MEDMSLRNYAYIGDAVWELFVREKTVKMTDNAKNLHKITTERVKASYQAELFRNFENELTDEEKEIARRARNLPIPVARRSNQTEYRQATAFETLIGWWYYYDKERLYNYLSKIEKI
ncbi:ribonuclease III [bacterium]|nr:ribonuclease III [bacterium]